LRRLRLLAAMLAMMAVVLVSTASPAMADDCWYDWWPGEGWVLVCEVDDDWSEGSNWWDEDWDGDWDDNDGVDVNVDVDV
jgi:hypothetical protein